MYRLIVALLLCVPAASAMAADPSAKSDEKFKLVHVDELAKALGPSSTTRVYDANDSDFRAKHGVIPGAILLTSFNKYDASQELPKDKSTPLVFYCANSH